MNKPIYRAEAKGMIREFVADFVATYTGEVSDEFTFSFYDPELVRETNAYKEYSLWLTDAEMLRAAKTAQ